MWASDRVPTLLTCNDIDNAMAWDEEPGTENGNQIIGMKNRFRSEECIARSKFTIKKNY